MAMAFLSRPSCSESLRGAREAGLEWELQSPMVQLSLPPAQSLASPVCTWIGHCEPTVLRPGWIVAGGVRTTLALPDWNANPAGLAAARDQTPLLPDAFRCTTATDPSLKEMSVLSW